ncbi:MAG: glycine/betaine ABC transporter substrate-binding protein [Acidimicrobiia bacterium]|nr:glycine/betaine ABC transporter substrate-binding protein [Acidimicrobiia bacterium]MDQ3499951.1 glycine/betaine ABC transporter substrate-binding protein [Actinomycetota bacterium]
MKNRLLLGLTILSLFVAACGGGTAATTGGDTPGTTAAGDDPGTTAGDAGTVTTMGIDSSKPTINLVVNAWTASALNVEIAKQLIEGHLGYPVEAVTIDENAAMYTGLADGTLDAVLELWPSGITEDEQTFLDEGTVVNIGELGAVGQIGWFVPDYVIAEHPELATWEGFQDPANAALFATAETGDQGRFLGTDPSYSQYDEPIIANLELPFEVVYSGSEAATVAELDLRVAAQEPILMYWWTPTAAFAKYNLVQVELPAYSDECYAEVSAVDCAYPEDRLIKLASAQLEEKAPDVFEFLSNFTQTTEDQLSMLPAAEIDGEDLPVVAKGWIDANQDIWQAWLP